jgi:hypothetical protein
MNQIEIWDSGKALDEDRTGERTSWGDEVQVKI